MKSLISIIPVCEREKLVYLTIKNVISAKVVPSRILFEKEFGYFSIYLDSCEKCICRVVAREDKDVISIYFPATNRSVEVFSIDEIQEYSKYVYLALREL